jgi:hypothetical protein
MSEYTGPTTDSGIKAAIDAYTSVVLHGTPNDATFARLQVLLDEQARRKAAILAPVTGLSDELLEADINVIDQRISSGQLIGASTQLRYQALIRERHSRLNTKGLEQAQRLRKVEAMLEEVASLEPNSNSPFDVSGWSYEVDDVERDGDGLIIRIYGTAVHPDHQNKPYLLGEV